MPRIVLDTVVLIRALINPHGDLGRLLFEWAGHYRLVVSPLLFSEYIEVTARPELVRKFQRLPEHRHDMLDLLSHAEVVTFDALPTFDRDPDDAHVLATAVAGRADYLISGDNEMLDLGEYAGTSILSAASFIQLLERDQ